MLLMKLAVVLMNAVVCPVLPAQKVRAAAERNAVYTAKQTALRSCSCMHHTR